MNTRNSLSLKFYLVRNEGTLYGFFIINKVALEVSINGPTNFATRKICFIPYRVNKYFGYKAIAIFIAEIRSLPLP